MRSFFELVLSVVLLGACGMPAQEAPLLTPTITPNAAPNATPTAVPEPTPSPTITPTPTSQQADQQPLRGMKLTPAFPGLDLDRMVHMAEPDDGTSRLFVVLQPGEIIVFERNDGPQSAATFLDIRSRVNDSGNEEGLLSMAFDPAFAENGYFYVYYTSDEGGRHSVVSRFEISGNDLNEADPSSETIILEVDQPAANHNGGQIAFGPDGYLYIGLGDGGRAGDPWGNGQDLSTLLASILRIDVNALDETGSYAVPNGNPFVDTPGARPEIWAYGLRNPWRFSFDRQTGDMWAGDVGQNRAEEIDIIQPGLDYGWNVMEGFECYQPSRNCDEQGLTMPVTEYGRSSGCSVTGGFVYRGEREPSLRGAYLYADYCSGNVWGLRHDGEGVTEQRLLVDGGPNISSFAEDLSGEVYLLAFDGSIYVLESE